MAMAIRHKTKYGPSFALTRLSLVFRFLASAVFSKYRRRRTCIMVGSLVHSFSATARSRANCSSHCPDMQKTQLNSGNSVSYLWHKAGRHDFPSETLHGVILWLVVAHDYLRNQCEMRWSSKGGTHEWRRPSHWYIGGR